MNERLRTPRAPVGMDAALWVATLEVDELAFLAGAVCAKLADRVGITQAELFADWARRAAADPDRLVVRPA